MNSTERFLRGFRHTEGCFWGILTESEDSKEILTERKGFMGTPWGRRGLPRNSPRIEGGLRRQKGVYIYAFKLHLFTNIFSFQSFIFEFLKHIIIIIFSIAISNSPYFHSKLQYRGLWPMLHRWPNR